MRTKPGIGKRVAVITAASLAFFGASAIAAAPAQAAPPDCVAYLALAGYGGVEYSAACTLGGLSYILCHTTLILLGVPPAIADTACRLAA
jgi:hypothetical protein